MFDCASCGCEIPGPRAGRKKFCNRYCYNGARPVLVKKRACNSCGKDVLMRENRHSAQPRVYCNMNCRRAHWHGENAPKWNGGQYIDGDGYRHLTVDGERRPEHIRIAEKALGRRLQKGEVVHHINGIKTDNRNSNLLICDQKYHMWLHAEMSRRYQQEHFI